MEDDHGDGAADDASRPGKRRKVNGNSKAKQQTSAPPGQAVSPVSPPMQNFRGGGGAGPPRDLAIQPIGFAASREARGLALDHQMPSPVVMGFDFKAVNDSDLKTVRRASLSFLESLPVSRLGPRKRSSWAGTAVNGQSAPISKYLSARAVRGHLVSSFYPPSSQGRFPFVSPMRILATQSLPHHKHQNQAVKALSEAETTLMQVRETISIKEQQQALIAQRRRDNAGSTPNTPKELTFKGWQPKDEKASTGVGRRREKTREKVEKMSINTSAHDKDNVPASKVSRSTRFSHFAPADTSVCSS